MAHITRINPSGANNDDQQNMALEFFKGKGKKGKKGKGGKEGKGFTL